MSGTCRNSPSLLCRLAKVGRYTFAVTLSQAFGCGPAIRSFDISPRVVCERETAQIHWNVRGEPTMDVALEPQPDDSGTCPGWGHETLAYMLVATKGGKKAQRRIEVIQLRASGADPIAIATTSIDDGTVVATGEKNAALWTSRVRVETVAACQNRLIEVRHAGRTIELAADGTPAQGLSGTELPGTWELRSPMSRDEQKTPGLRPKELEILATFSCAKGTQ
jgi:hypothetical protein